MKKFVLITVGVILFLALASTVAYKYLTTVEPPVEPVLSAAVRSETIRAGNLDRSYLAYIPEHLAVTPALVFALHGSKGDGQTMRVFTGYEFDRLADQYGFIVVYPDGYENHWNDCRKTGPYTANTLNIDDPAFFRAMIQRFKQDYSIDPSRVFALGFSNGGHMAYRLALEMPRKVSAVAAIGANLPAPDNMDCTPSGQPVSVLIMNGKADPINPYEGGKVTIYGFGNRGNVLSATETARYFSQLTGMTVVDPHPVALSHSDNNPGDTKMTWTTSPAPEVSLITVEDGGHTIPQTRFRFPRLLGRTSTSINGPEEIWNFLSQQAELVDGRQKRDINAGGGRKNPVHLNPIHDQTLSKREGTYMYSVR